jgi:hypothetical protein
VIPGRALVLATLLPVVGCAQGAAVVPRTAADQPLADPTLVPVGFGTLRQDDIAVRVQLTGGLQVRALPLDESVLRTLSPDSYRALRGILASKRPALDSLHRRFRLPRYSVWFVSFFAPEQGETRFSPMEFIITNTGRDFRPLDLVPLTPGFGEYRLRQREVQSALFVFDGQLDVNQPLSIIVETTEGGGWIDTLKRIDRERALIRSRASRGAPDSTPPRPPGVR